MEIGKIVVEGYAYDGSPLTFWEQADILDGLLSDESF